MASFQLIFFLLFFQRLRAAPLTAVASDSGTHQFFARNFEFLQFGPKTTTDIVISCLTTIFACTWTAVHPNIAKPVNSTVLRKQLFRLGQSYIAFFMPETITMLAFGDRLAAANIANQYNTRIFEVLQKQSLATTPAHNPLSETLDLPPNPSSAEIEEEKVPAAETMMILDKKSSLEAPEKEATDDGQTTDTKGLVGWLLGDALPHPLKKGEIPCWTITHGHFLRAGGFITCKNGRRIEPLQLDKMISLIEQGAIDAPIITEEELNDRSKSDLISRIVVLYQTIRFISQCILQWSSSSPFTLLEVVTLGYAALNLVTYSLWWYKPKDAEVPVYLEIIPEEQRNPLKPLEDGTDEQAASPTAQGSIFDPETAELSYAQALEERVKNARQTIGTRSPMYKGLWENTTPLRRAFAIYSVMAKKEPKVAVFGTSMAVFFGLVHLVSGYIILSQDNGGFTSRAWIGLSWAIILAPILILSQVLIFDEKVVFAGNAPGRIRKVLMLGAAPICLISLTMYALGRLLLVALSLISIDPNLIQYITIKKHGSIFI